MNPRRILPGDLVTFRTSEASVQLVRSSKKVRRYEKGRMDLSFTDDAEKNKLADMLEASRAVDCRMTYLTLAASEKRALLLKSDTCQMLVALAEDIRFVSHPMD